MGNSQVVVYVAAGIEQAHLLVNQLHEQGIRAYVANEPLHIADGALPFGLSTAPRVVVHEGDAARGRRIALEFETALRRVALADEPQDAEEDALSAAEWPRCPGCGRARH